MNKVEDTMNNNLNLNVLQDFIDINGGTIKLRVNWHKGEMQIAPTKDSDGAAVEFSQIPLSPTIETELKDTVLKNMPELNSILINKTLEVTQDVKEANIMLMQNKYKQAMDFDLELYSNRPAKIQAFTYLGIQRVEHDYTYVRALFTTNPYFATVFNGVRIVPYEGDIHALSDQVIETVKAYAKSLLAEGKYDDSILEFRVEKAFEVSFYLDDQDVTSTIHRMMNQNAEHKTSIDEFGFVSYIAYYQLFEGELNNKVAIDKI